MGMFDDIKCDYPLPWPEAQGGWFQTKDTPEQYLAKYKIDGDGQLWLQKAREWVRESLTAGVEIYAWHNFEGVDYWYEVKFWFRDGVVKDAVFNKRENQSRTRDQAPWPALSSKV